jgi:predicted nucleic acid-binding protein
MEILEVKKLLEGNNIYVSFITEIELLSYHKLDSSTETIIQKFLDNCIVFDLNQEIKDLTIEMRKSTNLKLPDSIIASTSYFLNIPLFTADKQFERVNVIDLILYQ